MQNLKSNSGFTLIEVLIALAIFSIGFMAMGALQTKSLIRTGEIGRKNLGTAFLTEQMEALKGMPFYAPNDDGLNNDGDGDTDEFAEDWADLLDSNPSDDTDFEHARNSEDGLFTVHWRVVDDEPLAPEGDIPGLPVSDTITVSKTITMTVTRAGGDAIEDAFLRIEFVKIFSENPGI